MQVQGLMGLGGWGAPEKKGVGKWAKHEGQRHEMKKQEGKRTAGEQKKGTKKRSCVACIQKKPGERGEEPRRWLGNEQFVRRERGALRV